MHGIIALFIPIFICVVLPVAIVWIVYRASMNKDNRRAEVLIKSIEANNGIDSEKLAEAMSTRERTPYELLNLRLLRGCIFSFVGVALLVMNILLEYWGYRGLPIVTAYIVGAVSIAVGVSYLIVYFITRKHARD